MISKSAVMRELYDRGYKIKEIAEMTNCHYSYVHTVIRKYEQGSSSKKLTTSDEIRKLYDRGHSSTEIKAILQVQQSFVCNVIRAYKRKEEEQQ